MADDPFEDRDAAGERRPPICGCGVTTIPAETATPDRPRFVCENPDCEAFGAEFD
jgi:hypothetical protein